MRLIFDWDANKAKVNLRKHKVSFDEAKTVFNDPLLITFPDDGHSVVEERQISIGFSANRRVLLVVHTERNETENSIIIRIISCRKATASERRVYEEG
ncbi:MAG: BrnT family toxin [Thermoflexales bacterium]|nr:BrnT family toxin [Thermoflexales bacterium]